MFIFFIEKKLFLTAKLHIYEISGWIARVNNKEIIKTLKGFYIIFNCPLTRRKMLFSVVNIYIRNKFVNVSKNGDAKIVLSQMRNIQWESWLRSSEYCFHSIFVPDLVMIQINFGIDLRFSKHSIIISSHQKIWKIAPQSWKFRNMISLLLKCETILRQCLRLCILT